MKRFLFALCVTVFPLLSFSQETNEEREPSSFNNYALYYAADFDALKYGNFGADCESFDIYQGIGMAFSVGWTTKMSACIFKIGPAYCIPFNDFMALSLNAKYAGLYGDKYQSAFATDPHLIFKAGRKFRINLGLDVIVVKDATSFGPYFGIGIDM